MFLSQNGYVGLSLCLFVVVEVTPRRGFVAVHANRLYVVTSKFYIFLLFLIACVTAPPPLEGPKVQGSKWCTAHFLLVLICCFCSFCFVVLIFCCFYFLSTETTCRNQRLFVVESGDGKSPRANLKAVPLANKSWSKWRSNTFRILI